MKTKRNWKRDDEFASESVVCGVWNQASANSAATEKEANNYKEPKKKERTKFLVTKFQFMA